jgi:diguanylate cyclase (GGDEF)-like protein
MKYTGRIFTTTIAIVIAIVVITVHYFQYRKIDIADIVIGLIMILFSWFFMGKQYDKVKYLSEKDILTDLYNRRFVLGIFNKLLALVERNNQKLSVFVVDIDNFKHINDTYGHLLGDKVLAYVSNILSNNTRKSDIVARWGGDEFLIVAPNTDETCPIALLERIQSKLEHLSEELGVEVTVSIGAATYPVDGKDLDSLIKVADHIMYKCKKELT